MSVPVELDNLRGEITKFGQVFLLTVMDDQRPHAVAVTIDWDGDRLLVAAGRTSVANALKRTEVTLLWPAVESGGVSPLLDGRGAAAGGERAGPPPPPARPHPAPPGR